MSALKHLFKQWIDPQYHVLVEADYVGADGSITEDGERALMQELFITHKDALIARATKRVADRAKKN